jgi:regulator of PEP synthase PpsR (kinase-PPPase family)
MKNESTYLQNWIADLTIKIERVKQEIEKQDSEHGRKLWTSELSGLVSKLETLEAQERTEAANREQEAREEYRRRFARIRFAIASGMPLENRVGFLK